MSSPRITRNTPSSTVLKLTVPTLTLVTGTKNTSKKPDASESPVPSDAEDETMDDRSDSSTEHEHDQNDGKKDEPQPGSSKSRTRAVDCVDTKRTNLRSEDIARPSTPRRGKLGGRSPARYSPAFASGEENDDCEIESIKMEPVDPLSDLEDKDSLEDKDKSPSRRNLRGKKVKKLDPEYLYFDNEGSGDSESDDFDPGIESDEEEEEDNDEDDHSIKKVKTKSVASKTKKPSVKESPTASTSSGRATGVIKKSARLVQSSNKVRVSNQSEKKTLSKEHVELLQGRIMELKLRKLDDLTTLPRKRKRSPNELNVQPKPSTSTASPAKVTKTVPPIKKPKLDPAPVVIKQMIEFPEFDCEDDDSFLLEVCVDNYQSIINAGKGGAKRVELCSSLVEGGLTPTPGLLRMAKANLKIPVFVMIRPRGGDFCYSTQEIEIMTMDIVHYKEMGADGFVFGVLDKYGCVDEQKCKILMKAADPLPCTFHRAFDMVSHPLNSLKAIIKLGFSRILTSGQQATAKEGIPYLRELVRAAGYNIIIMAGAGVGPHNVAEIIRETGVKEVHGSAKMEIITQMLAKEIKGVKMGAAGTSDNSWFVTDHKVVAEIVKNGSSALRTFEVNIDGVNHNFEL